MKNTKAVNLAFTRDELEVVDEGMFQQDYYCPKEYLTNAQNRKKVKSFKMCYPFYFKVDFIIIKIVLN